MLTTVLVVLGYIVFGVVLLLGLTATAVGLPGTTLIFLDALVYAAITHWERVPWPVLVVLGIMAIIAESSDSLIAAMGAKAGGGSNRTSAVVVIGTIVGAVVAGAIISPALSLLGLAGGPGGFVIGVLLPPLAGGVTGGFLAAYYYEKRTGKEHEDALRAGWGAFFGRMAAGLIKGLVGCLMIAILIYCICACGPAGG